MRNQRVYRAAFAALLLALIPASASAEGTFFKNRTPAAPATPQQPTQATTAPAPATTAPAPDSTTPPEPDVARISGEIEQVITTSTFVVAGQQFELFGVIGEPSPYVEALTGWLTANGNRLDCQPEGGKFRCFTPGKVDVGGVVIFNGVGKAAPDAPLEYRNAEAQARSAGKGVWQG